MLSSNRLQLVTFRSENLLLKIYLFKTDYLYSDV